MYVLTQDDEPGYQRTEIRCRAGATLGGTRYVPSGGYMVNELRFDTVLDLGDRTVVDCEWLMHEDGPQSLFFVRRFTAPIRQYVVEVQFDIAALPVKVDITRAPIDRPSQATKVDPRPKGCVRAVFLDEAAGSYGLRWTWEVLPPPRPTPNAQD